MQMQQLLLTYFKVFCAMLLLAGMAEAHEKHTKPYVPLAVSVAMDAKQQLWLAKVEEGHVLVSKSQDMGQSFSTPVNVNPIAMLVAASGESRPKLAIATNGNIYLTWKAKANNKGAGNIWFARSIDGGKQFEKPFIVHQETVAAARRESTLQLSDDGKITVAWLDASDAEQAKLAGEPYRGTAIYYAVSNDEGKSFEPAKKLTDSSCECCRIASSTKPDGTVVLLWRHVFEGMQRDHMMAEIPKAGATPDLHRASFGRWKIEGCPHHGGTLVRGGKGEQWWGYHLAYFDGKDKKPGLYYTRMDGKAWASVPAKQFGDFNKQAGHPVLWSSQKSQQENIWRVWREMDGEKVLIMGQYSIDGGRVWEQVNVLASAIGKADYPQLVGDNNAVFLVWNTQASGLLVKPL